MKHRVWSRLRVVTGAVALCAAVVTVAMPVLPASAQVTPPQNPQGGSAGVQGTVQTPPPKNAATIVTPTNGQTFTRTPITVSGLCTTDLLVKVFDNNVFVGSAICKSGSYTLQIDLFDGRNDLVARIFDSLDQPGPDSNIVTVTYNSDQFQAVNATKLTLTSAYARRGANPGEQLVWPITVSGGTAPYAISVDWGDGKGASLYSAQFAGNVDMSHVYDNAGVYVVIVKATDKNGQTAFLQLVGQANGAISQSASKDGNFNTLTTTRTVYSWIPILIAVPLILFSFWLGRRYELTELRKHLEGMHD